MGIGLFLLFVTILIFWFQTKIWRLEKNIVFPIVTGVFYFWSLAGAWLFIFDKLTGFGKSIGLDYYYLMEKMFPVELDTNYLKSLAVYAFFILFFQLFCWIGIKFIQKRKPVDRALITSAPTYFSSTPIAILSVFCLIGSFLVVKDVIFYSLILDESVYINIRSSQIPLYSIHQYLNWIMIVSLFLYLGLYWCKSLTFAKIAKPKLFFWIMFVICNLYLLAIGSRHETFFAGLLVIILMSFPFRSIRANFWKYAGFVFLLGIILMLNDPIRSMMPRIAKGMGITGLVTTSQKVKEAELYQLDRSFSMHHSEKTANTNIRLEALRDTVLQLKNDTIRMKMKEFFAQIQEHPDFLMVDQRKILIPNPHVSEAYDRMGTVEKILKIGTNLIFSNELFAGHFSMYGIEKFKVKPSYGISFFAILENFKSKSSRNKDVKDSYQYYASELNFPKDQGFTINHISSWIINASYFGCLLGAFLLALIILVPFYVLKTTNSNLMKVILLVVCCSFAGFSAILVRSGPEAYKSLLYEGMIIPVCIILSMAFYTSIMKKLFPKKH